MAANDAVSMNVAENRQNVPMAIQENRAAVPMTVAEGGGTPGGLNRKADKVTGAVAGNLAGLDANGNLTDSGKAPGDFLEAPATAGSEGQVLTADGEGGASWQDPTGGDPTEIIDDEAGSGDTDKVWSADKSHELLTEITNAQDDVSDLQKNKAPVIIDSAEGNPIVLTDGADGLPIEGMKIHFLPKQDTSGGDPSPSHVCPISGWSGVTAWRTSKNYIADATIEQGSFNINNGNDMPSDTRVRTNGKWAVPKGQYKIGCDQGYEYVCYVYAMDNSFIDAESVKSWTDTSTPMAIIGERKIRCGWRKSNNSAIVPSEISHPFVSIASESSSYPVTFGQTVYGGTFDAVNGVLTVDKQIYNLSDISWNKDTNRPGIFYGGITGREISSDVIACSTYLVTNTNISTSPDKSISGYPNYGGQYIFLRDTAFAEMTATEMKDAVTGQLVYKLATPIEIPIDPIAVQTLIGDNTIWSDANGDIELDYRADTKLFVGGYYKKPETGIPASDLESGVIPTVPAIATSAQIKAGTDSTHPIAPNRQNESVFYGLAKLAGADMASLSGETVGVYPDAQKVAIQKMLGIYESTWELIREDTVTNATETDVEITVDGNGNAYELTDVYMQVWTPQQETAASIGDYGTVRCYYDSSNYITSQMNTWTQAANASARYGQVLLENKNGAILNIVTQNATQYSSVNMVARTNIVNNDALMKIGTFAFDKIVIKKVTGTVKYKLYGKRKWTA